MWEHVLNIGAAAGALRIFSGRRFSAGRLPRPSMIITAMLDRKRFDTSGDGMNRGSAALEGFFADARADGSEGAAHLFSDMHADLAISSSCEGWPLT